MSHKFLRAVIVILVIGGGLIGLNRGLRHERLLGPPEMLGTPDSSPDGKFEVRCDRVKTLSSLFRPARGSDDDEGYVRLYEKDSGEMIEEAFCGNLNAIAISWNDNSVGFSGPDGMVWKLPR